MRPFDSGAVGDALWRTGQRVLNLLQNDIDEADPDGLIRAPARLLCCGLSELANQAHLAVAGPTPDAVLLAAAKLALLTKLDDEVIDSPAFHGGATTDRTVLRARLTAFLAPTLLSLRTAHPADDSPRCLLAARLGQDLRDLAADDARLHALLDLIAHGWAIQVDGVLALTGHAEHISEHDLRVATGNISGAWLAMVSLVGWLVPAAPRWCTPDELTAFFDWGVYIQAADALADLDKEVPEGLGCSLPVHVAWQRWPGRVERALLRHDVSALYDLIAQADADACAVVSDKQLAALDERMRALGGVHDVVHWVHGFLMGRYSQHTPFREPAVVQSWQAWAPTHGASQEVACLAC